MEQAYRTETTVAEDGTLNLHDLPFGPGETLEVILIPRAGTARTTHKAPLRGSVLRYDDPTGPVAEDDWKALG